MLHAKQLIQEVMLTKLIPTIFCNSLCRESCECLLEPLADGGPVEGHQLVEDVAHVVEGAGRQAAHRDGARQPVDDAGPVGGTELT